MTVMNDYISFEEIANAAARALGVAVLRRSAAARAALLGLTSLPCYQLMHALLMSGQISNGCCSHATR